MPLGIRRVGWVTLNHTQIIKTNHKKKKKTVGREGGKNRKRPPEQKAIKGGCASTRGHSANLECSFEVREGQIWALNRKVKKALFSDFRHPTDKKINFGE